MREPITTTDNNQGVSFGNEHADNLRKLSEHPLRELDFDGHPNLLVFPQDFKTYGDEIGKERIFTIEGDKLKTGNIMGFVGYNGTKVRIHSRFATDDGKDYFLHYMLRRVFAINLFDLKYDSDEEGIFDFLIYLFPSFLKCALRQGLYREYHSKRYNDANVRGRIDVSQHIRQNMPFAGKISYTTREYTSDNYVTQLVRHTIEYLAAHSLGMNILCNDDETKDAISIINAATPTYDQHERSKIVGKNLRPVSHPYFIDYLPLQRLCLQILRHDELKYGKDDNQIYGILFDGSWLWEEYLATLLEPLEFKHPHNKTDKAGKYVFSNPLKVKSQPDFFIDRKVVLDAKYKRHKSLFEAEQREDRFQLLAYMHIFETDCSGLIVPVDKDEIRNDKAEINGRGGMMHLFGLKVSHEENSFQAYVDAMSREETELIQTICAIES